MKLKFEIALSLSILIFVIPSTCSVYGAKWAVSHMSTCNATCGKGYRSAIFKCFENRDAEKVPNTSPVLFLSTLLANPLSDDLCKSIPKPTLLMDYCGSNRPSCGPEGQISKGFRDPQRPRQRYTNDLYLWDYDMEGLGKCSADCVNPGYIMVKRRCRNRYTRNFMSASSCGGYGAQPYGLVLPCRKWQCGPTWRVGAWSRCSVSCGRGVKKRQIYCVELVSDGEGGQNYRPLPRSRCDTHSKPHVSEFCVESSSCQAFWKAKSFGECKYGVPCDHGIMDRDVTCWQIRGNVKNGNNEVKVEDKACQHLVKPESWTSCIMPPNPGEQCEETEEVEVPKPKLKTKKTVFVQMRRGPRVRLRCGQKATLIPGTNVVIGCGVLNYKRGDLNWHLPRTGVRMAWRGAAPDSATGALRGRIFVDKKGRLRIRKFQPSDAGQYKVQAENATAHVHLGSHSAYEAMRKHYRSRAHILFKRMKALMMADQGGSNSSRPRSDYVWVTSSWGACTIPCGGTGERVRKVTCEKVSSDQYHIVADSMCEDLVKIIGAKPAENETCGDSPCPKWQTGPWDRKCSSTRCYEKRYARRFRTLTCVLPGTNEAVHRRRCRHLPQPETWRRCANRRCTPRWVPGAWSRCSVSCGAPGYRSRTMSCRWAHNHRAAGFACYQAGLSQPIAYEACHGGPCYNLACVDLSRYCEEFIPMALCAHSSLRQQCCHTCNLHRLSAAAKMAKKMRAHLKTTK